MSKSASRRSSKTRKDKLTGLSIQLPGSITIFKSDQPRTVDPMTLGMEEQGGDVTAEVELSRDYIVWTISGVTGTTRIAWKGSYSYNKKGGLSKASVTEVAQDWGAFESSDGGIITKYKNGTLDIRKPEGLATLASQESEFWETSDTYRRWPHQNSNGEEAIASGTINGVEVWSTGQGKQALETFAEGKLFYDGWHNEPFSTNLI